MTKQQPLLHANFFWEEPDPPPPNGPSSYDMNAPFAQRNFLAVPNIGEPVSIELKTPESIGLPIQSNIVHGTVTGLIEKPDNYFDIKVKREARAGLSYYDLCFCIGATMVGYHEYVGRIEGQLLSLLPSPYELAIIQVPDLKDLIIAISLDIAAMDGNNDQNELKELKESLEEDDAVVILPWSCIWTKEGIEIMNSARS